MSALTQYFQIAYPCVLPHLQSVQLRGADFKNDGMRMMMRAMTAATSAPKDFDVHSTAFDFASWSIV